MGMLWAKLWKLFGKEGEPIDVWFCIVRQILVGRSFVLRPVIMAWCVWRLV